MAKKKTISISLVTRNRLKALKQMLEHFFKNTTVSYELFIIDNGSTDGTVDFLKKEVEGMPNVTIIYNEKNYGIAYAVNQGWYRAMRKEYLVKVDDNVILPPNWAEEMIKICDRIPEVGCVGINFEDISYPEIEVNRCLVQKKETPIEDKCLMVARRAFDKVGYLNESLFGYAGEELGWRVINVGFWNVYHPDLHLQAKIVEDSEPGESLEIKKFVDHTGFRVAMKFLNYYREVSEQLGKPETLYIAHVEDFGSD
jgi:GT2 family glycosyltransferase